MSMCAGENDVDKQMLDEFVAWAARRGSPELGELTDNPSTKVDFESAHAIARITYWASGHCDAEVIEIYSGNVLYQQHWENLRPEQLDKELVGFFAILDGEP